MVAYALIAWGLLIAREAISGAQVARPAVSLSSTAIARFSAGTALLAAELTASVKAFWACSVFASCACSAARFDGAGAAR